MGVIHRSLWYIYSQYTRIETEEQRSRYKDDFNAEYSIYRDLHTVIEKVSKKFAQLEERLREEERGTERYQV
jgi:RNA polymerase II elongation factor ELL